MSATASVGSDSSAAIVAPAAMPLPLEAESPQSRALSSSSATFEAHDEHLRHDKQHRTTEGESRAHSSSSAPVVSSLSACVVSSPAGAPSHLFADGLRLVALCLGAEEWRRSQMWRTCKQWSTAMRSMHSLDFHLGSGPAQPDEANPTHAQLASLAASPLGLHFTGVTLKIDASGWAPLQASVSRMTWLRVVHLDLSAPGSCWRAFDFDQLSSSLPHLDTIRTSLDEFTPSQLRAVGQMESLRSFRRYWHWSCLRQWSQEDSRSLCWDQRLHHLTDLGACETGYTLSAALLEEFARLPSLRLVSTSRADGDDADGFDSEKDPPVELWTDCLPYLRTRFPEIVGPTMRLNGARSSLEFESLSPRLFIDYADVFGRVETLELRCFFARTEELAECLAVMTRLTTLTLERVDIANIDELAVANKLTSLTLTRCPRVDFDALCRLVAFPRLTRLRVKAATAVGALTDEQAAALTPPSAHLPTLTKFIYAPSNGTHLAEPTIMPWTPPALPPLPAPLDEMD